MILQAVRILLTLRGWSVHASSQCVIYKDEILFICVLRTRSEELTNTRVSKEGMEMKGKVQQCFVQVQNKYLCSTSFGSKKRKMLEHDVYFLEKIGIKGQACMSYHLSAVMTTVGRHCVAQNKITLKLYHLEISLIHSII